MDPRSNSSVTELLRSIRAGDTESLDALFSIVYDELHSLAKKVGDGHRKSTLNTTALVHEAYLKLAGHGNWESRLHFMRTAARAMRQIIISGARRQMAQKRGGDLIDVTFQEEFFREPVSAEKLVHLDDALLELQQLDPRMAQVVECRFFAGLSIEETAEALEVSSRTIKRDWRTARAFLADALKR